ncbi:gamma carbonic anhydrase family protein [Cellulosilyticum sp. I15G10I2]|uniref:gamma carbonic anhydrase family protein n=1 Tax=Cellulosilyticum sp. I15G10I2 TaxID=1892843 RepID=UPI00085C8622|nr:gamma carbonic anhydrase family protein [Cellulosilyticum sp. I15G10I2]
MIHPYKNELPEIDQSCFVAEGAHIIGKVRIGKACSIWYNAVLRGDVETITIGDYTNVQDNVVIHVSKQDSAYIGEGVTIGHSAIIHGATIGEYTLIGMGSTILDGARIGKNCIIGANSLVTAGTIIPDGMLVIGTPARVLKPLDEAQVQHIKQSAEDYVQLAKAYSQPILEVIKETNASN